MHLEKALGKNRIQNIKDNWSSHENRYKVNGSILEDVFTEIAAHGACGLLIRLTLLHDCSLLTNSF